MSRPCPSNTPAPCVPSPDRAAAIEEALAVLGVERFVLGVHDSAFPAAELDTGYGSPRASAARVFELSRALGFSGLMLGPAGQISDANVSPYDATAFARNELCLSLPALCELELGLGIDPDALRTAQPSSMRVDVPAARRRVRAAIAVVQARLDTLQQREPEHSALAERAAFVRREHDWLELDALYEAFAERVGVDDARWFDPAVRALFDPGPQAREHRGFISRTLGAPYERAVTAQWLLHRQARELHVLARSHDLLLYSDLQIGWSVRDRFLRPELFASGWRMGAPPSRTNPLGQPWGYPLLDPDQLDDPTSPARRAFQRLIDRAFSLHDGLRIDHPHGLVCPWIYDSADPDPLGAVQRGTRAFESPDRAELALRRWAIARMEDLDPTCATRYADGWVRRLDERQIARYSRLFDVIVDAARRCGRDPLASLAVEVLSTCPSPLAQVLARHGLGRFVVTQKADPLDPKDVYRTDRVRAEDWVMLGNHDTPPIFALAEGWLTDGRAAARARYLAERLEPEAARRADAARSFTTDATALVHAELADLFACAARNVLVSFVDLFGEREPFNRAGIVHPDNWSLRMPPDPWREHGRRCAAGKALDVGRALALALHARSARPDLQSALTSAV